MSHASYIVTLFGIFTALSWGVSDFLSAKSTKLYGPILSGFMVSIIGTITVSILFLGYVLLTHHHMTITPLGVTYAVLSGIVFAAGELTFCRALEDESVSIVSPLTGVYPLITTIVALVVFHVHLTVLELGGIVLVVFGVAIASGILSIHRSNRESTSGPIFAMAAAVSWGVGYALLGQSIARMNWQAATFISYILTVVTMFFLIPFIRGHEVINRSTFLLALRDKTVFSAGMIQLIGEIALIIGITLSTSSGGAIVTTISASYPILTIFLALKSFDEDVRMVRIVGAVVGIIGMVLLTVP